MKKNIKDMTKNEFFEINYKSLIKKFFEFNKYNDDTTAERVIDDFINQITYIVLMFIRSTYELDDSIKLVPYENFKDIFLNTLHECLYKSELKMIN